MSSTLTFRSASISLKALELGAADYIAKPSAKSGKAAEQFYRELMHKTLALGGHDSSQASTTMVAKEPLKTDAKPSARLAFGEYLNPSGIRALAIASSTGGPQALLSIFTQLKGHFRNIPIFITQHMPPSFTTILAEQLAKSADCICTEGKEGEIALPGRIYIAPGDFHMIAAQNSKGETVLSLNKNPQENFCRPSADPMLKSLSAIYGAHLAVVVLTGIGHDGLEGAKEVVKNGGSVVAQDEASCVVYGMPKAVAEHKLCKAVLPLSDIPKLLIEQINRIF